MYIPASRLVACPILCKRTYNALAADSTLNIFVVGLVVKNEDLHKVICTSFMSHCSF